ncbi:MAG: PorP/SprF family type IX secretion system membrane protein [Reichenbachiella sp.]
MKNLIYPFLLILLTTSLAHGQNLPIFHQKLTDDFMFNSAYTGISGGSVSVNYRKLWTGISQAPDIFYTSGHAQLKSLPIGLGGSLYTERQDYISNFRGSFSTSYQIDLSSEYSLSFGLGVEFFQSNIDQNNIFVKDLDDPLLDVPNTIQWDLSSGIVLSHELFDFGLGYGRMISDWSNDSTSIFASFVALNGNAYIPVRYGYDILEPRVFYQINPVGENILNASVFYTYDNQYLLGVSYRSESVGAVSIGLRWDNRYLLAYSVESRLDKEGSELGFGHELTLRFDLNKQCFRRVNNNTTKGINSSTFRKKSN